MGFCKKLYTMDIYVAGGIDLNPSVSVKVTFFYASFFHGLLSPWIPFLIIIFIYYSPYI